MLTGLQRAAFEVAGARVWETHALGLRSSGHFAEEAEDAESVAAVYWRRSAEELLAWFVGDVSPYEATT